MRKNIIISAFICLFLFFSCKSYIKEVPYKFSYNQNEIKKDLHIKTKKIIDTLAQDYEHNLSDRKIYLKEKYSIVLGIKPEDLKNYKFYDFIDQWIGTKYASKGFKTDSLNIAPFISALFQYTYKKKLPSKPLEMFKSPELDLFTGRLFLQEGDLIFFRYEKDKPIGDVGVYLRNSRILVSTRRDGLIISDFNLDYFQLRYICAGRIKLSEENVEK